MSTGMKGDPFVEPSYVAVVKYRTEELRALVSNGATKEQAEQEASLLREAREMLLKWEQGDKEILDLWNKMNAWCYEGFEETFKTLGVDFEKHYKESDY